MRWYGQLQYFLPAVWQSEFHNHNYQFQVCKQRSHFLLGLKYLPHLGIIFQRQWTHYFLHPKGDLCISVTSNRFTHHTFSVPLLQPHQQGELVNKFVLDNYLTDDQATCNDNIHLHNVSDTGFTNQSFHSPSLVTFLNFTSLWSMSSILIRVSNRTGPFIVVMMLSLLFGYKLN